MLPPTETIKSESLGLSEMIELLLFSCKFTEFISNSCTHAAVGKMKLKKEYYFGPVLCRVWSTEFVNTRETSAILCWLKRGDQLGSRRDAKRL